VKDEIQDYCPRSCLRSFSDPPLFVQDLPSENDTLSKKFASIIDSRDWELWRRRGSSDRLEIPLKTAMIRSTSAKSFLA
jgi:hypothetical protein